MKRKNRNENPWQTKEKRKNVKMPMHTAVTFAYTRYPPWKCLCTKRQLERERDFNFFSSPAAAAAKNLFFLLRFSLVTFQRYRDLCLSLSRSVSHHRKHTYQLYVIISIPSLFSLFLFVFFFSNTIGSFVWRLCGCIYYSAYLLAAQNKMVLCVLYRLLFFFVLCVCSSLSLCVWPATTLMSTLSLCEATVCVCDTLGTKYTWIAWRVVEFCLYLRLIPQCDSISAPGFHHWFPVHHRCRYSGWSNWDVEEFGFQQDGSHRRAAQRRLSMLYNANWYFLRRIRKLIPTKLIFQRPFRCLLSGRLDGLFGWAHTSTVPRVFGPRVRCIQTESWTWFGERQETMRFGARGDRLG